MMETTYIWEDIDRGTTRMTLRNLGKPKASSGLVAHFMSFRNVGANHLTHTHEIALAWFRSR